MATLSEWVKKLPKKSYMYRYLNRYYARYKKRYGKYRFANTFCCVHDLCTPNPLNVRYKAWAYSMQKPYQGPSQGRARVVEGEEQRPHQL